MSTIVFCHAHPDDEASQTSGTMARLAEEGHRVVVVYGTNGDHGEAPEDMPADTSLVQLRRLEAEESARILGTARVAWLGYADSGMTGWEQNHAENSFHGADVDEAAGRLAVVLDEEGADVLVGYDWHGGYGHPDHVKVHHVVHRAAELAARRPRVLESTMNRTAMLEMIELGKQMGLEGPDDFDPAGPMDDGNPMGTLAEEITWRADVSSYVDRKRAALQAHASQPDARGLLEMPDFVFDVMFGHEHYIEPGVDGPMREEWPF